MRVKFYLLYHNNPEPFIQEEDVDSEGQLGDFWIPAFFTLCNDKDEVPDKLFYYYNDVWYHVWPAGNRVDGFNQTKIVKEESK